MKYKFLFLLLFTSVTAFTQTADKYYEESLQKIENKDYQGSLTAIKKAISLDSNNSDYYNALFITLYNLKRYDDAYQVLNKGVSKFPKDAIMYNNRGNFYLQAGEFEESISDFTKAMRFAKNDTAKHIAINNRAAAKMAKRDFEGAYEDLMTVYNYDSTDLGVLTNLGAVCDEVGRGDETLKYLLKAVQIDPKFAGAYANIGFKYQHLGDHKKAIEYYNKVIELDPDEALGYSNRSFSKLKLGDMKGAEEDIAKSLKLYPENSYAYRIRALIYIEKKDHKMACKDLQIALDRGFTVTYGDEVINLMKKYCSVQQ